MTENKCCNCDNYAKYIMYWPGQDKKKLCSVHAREAIAIAQTLGFNLTIEEINEHTKR